MTRRCSHCSNNGHNSRTCPTRGGAATLGGASLSSSGSCGGGGGGGGSSGGVRLFGVRLTDGSFMKKSASMGNLSHYHSNNSSTTASPTNNLNNPGSPSSDPIRVDGYLSDDPNHASCSSNRRSERKKGKPWTEEEHRLFLIGLQKLGKGDWRGIAKNYVVSRTPTQVASHAQKYFIRQSNATRRKRRSSLFDMVPDMVTEEPENVAEEQLLPPPPEPRETENKLLPSLDLSLTTEAEPMEITSIEEVKENEPQALSSHVPSTIPAFFVPIPYPSWAQPLIHPEEDNKCEPSQHHQVLKPTPVFRKEPVNVDELVGISQLNLSETENKDRVGSPQISLGLLGAPSRQSAFHASGQVNSADLNEGKNSVIQAV